LQKCVCLFSKYYHFFSFAPRSLKNGNYVVYPSYYHPTVSNFITYDHG